jgi:hydrogenase maturation protease
MGPRILIAGMGSELQSDDAFGLVVVRRLLEVGPLEGVEVFEAGTAGIGLVQQLMGGYEHLIIVDAAERDREPGSIYLLEPEIRPMVDYSGEDQQALLSDMHYTVPDRVLTLSQALGILPPNVLILGCQPADLDLGLELSPPVTAAVDEAVTLLRKLVVQLTTADRASCDQNPEGNLPFSDVRRGAGDEGI